MGGGQKNFLGKNITSLRGGDKYSMEGGTRGGDLVMRWDDLIL